MKKILNQLKENDTYTQYCYEHKTQSDDLTLFFDKRASIFDLEDMMHDLQDVFTKITYEIDGNLINGFVVKIFNYGNIICLFASFFKAFKNSIIHITN
jgi:hypothetical protein